MLIVCPIGYSTEKEDTRRSADRQTVPAATGKEAVEEVKGNMIHRNILHIF